MTEGERLASVLCKAINSIVQRTEDSNIDCLYSVCKAILAKKISMWDDELLNNSELGSVCGDFFYYMLTSRLASNLSRICRESRYALTAYLEKCVVNFLLKVRRDEINRKEKLKEALEKSFFSTVNRPTTPEPCNEKDDIEIANCEKVFPLILSTIISMSVKKRRAFLNRYSRQHGDSKDKFLEDETADNRYQLISRMHKELSFKFEKHGITPNDFKNFLQSDYMSDIERKTTY